MKNPDVSWLKKNLSKISADKVSNFSDICSEKHYSKGGWTALKLISLMYYASMYTTILKDKNKFKNLIYIDPFSGPGTVEISGNNDVHHLFGSSLLIPSLYGNIFDKFYLSDNKKKNVQCLKRRLEVGIDGFSEQKYIVKHEDANTSIIETLQEMPEKSHFLAFLDPEGLELDWETLKELLKHRGDVIVYFSSDLKRVHASSQSEKSTLNEDRLNRFFGTKQWKNCKTHEDYLHLYIDQMHSVSDIKVETLPIKSTERNLKYTLIFAAPVTSRNNPWLTNVVSHLNRKFEGSYDNIVRMALEILKGNQKELDYFIRDTDDSMTTLDDFL